MSQQPPNEPRQRLNIDDSSIEGSQIAQGGDDVVQIQGSGNQVIKFVCNLFAPQESSERENYRNRQILLNRVKNAWVKGVLEKSLHGQALIELGLEERLDAVEQPLQMVLENSEQFRQVFPSGTKIVDIFDQMGVGRTLLILGKPGSGKTTVLLELALDLIKRAEQDINLPIAVVLNLSSWKGGNQTIDDWLIEEINRQYFIPKKISKNWLEAGQLLLLLDGLDEVKLERRYSCIQALNRFRQEYGQTEIVICSRVQEYESLSNHLNLQSAIYLLPLTPEQINDYLVNAGSELEAVNIALQTDTILQRLAKTPLMLNVLTFACQGISLEDIPKANSIGELHKNLFDRYIQQMFARRKTSHRFLKEHQRYSKERTMHWLTWLAKKMSQESQTVFLIERMQPSWLQTKTEKRIYRVGNFLIFGLMGVLGGGLFFGLAGMRSLGLIGGLFLGLIVGLFFGPVFGLLSLLSREIILAEKVSWSLQKAKNRLIYVLMCGLIFGLIYVLTFGLHGLISGLISGLIFGLMVAIAAGFFISELEIKSFPNQGIWHSARNSAIVTLTFVPIFVFGPIFGLVFGLRFGGAACIQHFTLRLSLYYKERIPWNYARFLDYATERIFLQKVGGGYIFIHRLLQDHLAAMELE